MSKDSTKKNSSKKGSGMIGTAEESALLYPIMRLAQDMHRSSVDNNSTKELEMKVFEEISIELENPFLYQYYRNEILYPTYTFPSVIKSTAKVDEDSTNTKKEDNTSSTTGISETNDDETVLIEKMKSDMTISIAAKATTIDLQQMKERNDIALAKLVQDIQVATESAGDMEVLDAHIAVAQFTAKAYSKEETIKAYETILALPKISSGKKIDILMSVARVTSFYNDVVLTDEYLQRATTLAESGSGSDWDRRNRLKIYQSIQYLLHRNIQNAASLLLQCISTFNAIEYCTYTEFITYTILSNLLHLSRPEIKKQIIDGSEIITISSEIPEVMRLVKSFYDCDYKAYLHAMLDVEDILRKDRFLHLHTSYWMREFHILAYKQFLDSYQSVTIEAMAKAFGVSMEFIDLHASQYIASNRLSAKIDKYNGVIVSSRPDTKNAQYREIIKKGDALLNRIQKLARVVDL